MFKRWAFTFLLTAGLLAGTAQANELQGDLPLKYLEQPAADAPNPTLVILLHGYGSNEKDLFGLKDLLPAQATYLSVRAPLELAPGHYQWFRQKGTAAPYDGVSTDLAQAGSVLTDFIVKAAAKYHTPANRVYLVGFSQGAMMTYEVALRRPDVVGGIAALSGRLLPVVEQQMRGVPEYRNLQVFIGHGNADQRVGFSGATHAQEQLKKVGVTPQFHAYPGLGHSISEAEVGDLQAWLQGALQAR